MAPTLSPSVIGAYIAFTATFNVNYNLLPSFDKIIFTYGLNGFVRLVAARFETVNPT